jgi:hypothetical protein
MKTLKAIFFLLILSFSLIGQELPTQDGTSLVLKWSDTVYDNYVKLEKYNVYVSTNKFSFEPDFKTNALILNSPTNSLVVSNLNFGTTYYFGVTAIRNQAADIVETELSNGLVYTVPSTNNYISITKSNGFYEVRYKTSEPIKALNYTNLIKYDSISLK